MRSLFDFAVTRPVLAACINLLLVAIGIGAAFVLPVREYPDIDPPVVSVSVVYRGAPAEVVEREVTKIIEDNLSGIDDVRLIRSTSREEASQIVVEFRTGAALDGAAADVRDRVSAVRRDLPAGIEDPVVEKASADDFPMMYISLSAERVGTAELTDLADRVMVDALGTVPGVARVQIGGERRYAMRIWLNRQAMAARGITAGDVAARLRAENLEAPAGRLETGRQEITLRAVTRFTKPQEFAALVLREGGGQTGRVLLGDVAEVQVGVEEYRTGFRVDGQDAISLGIVRQSNANTLDVAKGVRDGLERLRPLLPAGIQMAVGYDESVFIGETLWNVGQTLLETILVIVVVIYLFLGSFRATIIPAATIPASIIPAAAVAAAFGYSINVLSILAVVLAIGLCVDDAVVILENVRRRQQQGEPATLAAVRATRQLGSAVFATAAVLLAVIVPLAFLEGNVGRLFREFAVVLAAIVGASTISALTLGPMLSAKLFRIFDETDAKPSLVARWGASALEWTTVRYRSLLGGTLARPWIAPLAGIGLAGVGVAAFLALPTELAPNEDRGAVSIVVEAPEGASFEQTAGKVAEIERAVADLVGTEKDRPVEQVLSILVPARGGTQAPSNTARIIMRLKPWNERDVTQAALQQTLQGRLSAIPGVRAFAVSPPKLGQRSRGRQLQFVLSGTSRDDVVAWSRTVLDSARSVDGLVSLDTNYKDTKPQVELRLDRDRASALGVTAQDVGDALQILFGSLEVTRYSDRSEEYEVILQARVEDRRSPDDLLNVFVRTRNGGQLVPLSAVVTTREIGAARELQRLDRLAAVTVEANLTPALPLGNALDRLDEVARSELPATAQVGYLGESLDLRETGNTVFVILALVLVLAYLVLAGQFESWLPPLVVLTTAPLSVAGGLVTLWAFGLTLNVYSQIGMVLLVGLAAKNGILIVEFANQLRDEGKTAREAVEEAAAARLRPILMTSVATVLGAVPLAVASGAGSEARAILGLVTAGGLTLGTLLTLFVVPALYVLASSLAAAPGAIDGELRELEQKHPEAGTAPAG